MADRQDLVAAAAPELLAALKAVADATVGKNPYIPHAITTQMMAAIAKAEGRSWS